MSAVPHALSVLLIEDDEIDRESVHRMLDRDYDVIDAPTGAEALVILREREPDCVLLDYRLPDATGLDMLRKLVRRGLPVVMMTSHGNEQIAVDAMKLGAQEYLVKGDRSRPLLVRTITGAIERAALKTELDRQRADLEAFVQTAAHDLRGPLRNIDAYATSIAEDLDSGNLSRARADVARVVDAVSRLDGLIRALLGYTQADGGRLMAERVQLDDILRTIVADLGPSLDKVGGRIETGPLPVVSGDPGAIRQLLQNLVDNALKFHDGKPPVVRIDARRDGASWTVRISDNGIGIGIEQQAEIFQPLRRLHGPERFDGHGLGLAICQRIVERLDGRIDVASQPGNGSTFSVTLPAAD